VAVQVEHCNRPPAMAGVFSKVSTRVEVRNRAPLDCILMKKLCPCGLFPCRVHDDKVYAVSPSFTNKTGLLPAPL